MAPPKDADECSESSEPEVNTTPDCSRPEVVTKYSTAAVIANETLQTVIDACKSGADIAEICKLGDKLIEERCELVYRKKEKGEKVGDRYNLYS